MQTETILIIHIHTTIFQRKDLPKYFLFQCSFFRLSTSLYNLICNDSIRVSYTPNSFCPLLRQEYDVTLHLSSNMTETLEDGVPMIKIGLNPKKVYTDNHNLEKH